MARRLNVCFLLLFVSKCNSTLFLPDMVVNSLTKSAIKIIDNEAVGEYFLTCISIKTAYSWKSYHQHNDIINHIAHVINGISIVSMDDRNKTLRIPKLKEQTRFNVFIVDGINGFRILADQIPKGNFVFDGRFLVVINNITLDYINLVDEIFLTFFSQNIINVNILIPNPILPIETFMFTYYPYRPDRCSWPNVELYNVFSSDKFLEEKQHFPEKLETFYNCSIHVAAFNTFPHVKLIRDKNGNLKMLGIEGKLFNKIAELLDLNIQIHIPEDNWGAHYPNKSISGAFEMVYNNTANVTLGSFFYQFKVIELFDLTLSYHTTHLCFFVPPGRVITSMEKTLWPFQGPVWYILLSLVVLKILVRIPIEMLPQNRFLDNIAILEFVRIYFGMSITKYPEKFLSKVFVVVMFFSTLILRSSYQSSLFHLMAVTANVSTVNSVNDIVRKDFRIYVVEALEFVLDGLPQISSSNTIVVKNDGYRQFQNVPSDSKFVALSSRAHILGNLNPSNENIYQVALAMVLQKNSYFTKIFNDIISKLLCNGFVSKLFKNSERMMRKRRSSSTCLLSMDDVVGLIGMCFCGHVLALIIFILEIVSAVLKRSKKN